MEDNFKFRYPYLPGDAIGLTDDEMYSLALDADDYCLGYALLPLLNGSLDEPLELYGYSAPELKLQPWFEKDYSPEKAVQFWNDFTNQGQNINRDYHQISVILLADRRSIVPNSLVLQPRSEADFQTLLFTGHGRGDVILTDGHARLRAMQLTAHHQPNRTFSEVNWPVRVFDIGKIRNHPRAYELQYLLSFGDFDLI